MAYTLTYKLIHNDTEYSVTGYTGEPTNAVIPSIFDGKPVTIIDEYAFKDCSSLTNIVIPNSVTRIGRSAFYNCTSLTNIVIPNSVTHIGDYAFDGCSSLISITIPDSVTSINYAAFHFCTSLTNIVIPNSVTHIGDYAFSNCSSLESIEIPDSVTSVGFVAFKDCSSLTSVVIGDSVTSIGERAFEGCSRLTSVVIGGSVTIIGSSAFFDCSSLRVITLLAKTPANISSTTFPSGNTKFYCYSSALQIYKTTPNWNVFADNFVADDMRLYFTMNAVASKGYVDNKVYKKLDYVDNKVSKKLDMDTSTTTYNQVYVKAANGGQGTINVTKQAIADSIPQRKGDGNITVPQRPTSYLDAVSKYYVDSKIATLYQHNILLDDSNMSFGGCKCALSVISTSATAVTNWNELVNILPSGTTPLSGYYYHNDSFRDYNIAIALSKTGTGVSVTYAYGSSRTFTSYTPTSYTTPSVIDIVTEL